MIDFLGTIVTTALMVVVAVQWSSTRDWTQCEARAGDYLRALDRTCGRRIRVRLAHDFGPFSNNGNFCDGAARRCGNRGSLANGARSGYCVGLRRNIFGQSCAINRVPKHCGRCSSCTAFDSLVWHSWCPASFRWSWRQRLHTLPHMVIP